MANRVKFENTEFSVGDKIRIDQKIQEGDKIRTQPFEGLVISIKGRGENKKFVVRRIAGGGIGVERIFPLNSPWIDKVEVVKINPAKRAKLYYLRKRIGKKAVKVKTRRVAQKEKEKGGQVKKPGKLRQKSQSKRSSKPAKKT